MPNASILTFTAADHERGVPTPEQVQRARGLFSVYGYLIVENLLDPALVARLRDEFHARYLADGMDALAPTCLEVGDKRLQVTVKLEGTLGTPTLWDNPLLMPVMRALVGEDMILNSYVCIVAFPGSQLQHPHRDSDYLFEERSLAAKLPAHAVNLFIPFIDLDSTVGTTLVVDGSAADPTIWIDNMLDHPISFPHVKAGSVYLVDYRAMHAGTPNESDRPRPLMNLMYSRPWFRDVTNYRFQDPLDLSEEAFMAMSEERRKLFRHSPAALAVARREARETGRAWKHASELV